MADSQRKRYSRSPSPAKVRSRSPSRSRSRSMSPPRYRSHSRSRSRSRSVSRGRGDRVETNPGNTLFVNGLSTRITERDLEDFFSKEGKVSSVFLVVEPRTRVSRGFAFVTMDSVEDADRCIKYLNQAVLEGRCITVEKTTLHQLCWQQSMMTSFIHLNFRQTALIKRPAKHISHAFDQLNIANLHNLTTALTINSFN